MDGPRPNPVEGWNRNKKRRRNSAGNYTNVLLGRQIKNVGRLQGYWQHPLFLSWAMMLFSACW